jgi:dTDP-4-dehydrorhamnose 3,5-epimerase-like enzyme
MNTLLKTCKFIEFQDLSDHRGGLVSIEKIVPFEIKRLYYLFDQNNDITRGRHAHKKLEQLIIPIHGSFDLLLDDGKQKASLSMNNPKQGLYVCPMIWRNLTNFSSDAVCLVLASECYDEADYIRNYEEFLNDAQ